MTTALNATQARAALVRERLPEHLDRLGWSTERIAAHQRDELRRLLRTAIDHSPFHAARLHGVNPERVELSDLASLPIMTKAEMMAAYDDVVTDRVVTRARVEEHLSRTGWDAEVLDGRYVVMASGGSSGLRGVFTYTSDATAEFLLGCVRPGLARCSPCSERCPPTQSPPRSWARPRPCTPPGSCRHCSAAAS